MPHFLTVLNLEPEDRAVVKKGWERVLRARLEDARFYWNTDLRAGFAPWTEALDHVIFLGPLGSMGDKCRRLERLCGWLAGLEGVRASLKAPLPVEEAARAGRVAKADLCLLYTSLPLARIRKAAATWGSWMWLTWPPPCAWPFPS